MNPHQLTVFSAFIQPDSPRGGEPMAPPTKRTRNGKSSTKSKPPRRRRKEYEEEPGWATAFQREDNEPPQPQLTGVGVLDQETIDAITEADGNFQLAIWTKDRDGKPLRNRDGTRRLRIHIEPPYQDDDDDQDDADDYDDDPGRDDDMPF